MKHLSENLLVQFSLASFVMLTVIAVILAQVLASRLRQEAVDDVADEAIGASVGRLLSVLGSTFHCTIPMSGEHAT